MQETRSLAGRLLYLDGSEMFLARGRTICRSRDAGRNWEEWARVPTSPGAAVAVTFSLVARLLRMGIHHIGKSGSDTVIFANSATFCHEGGTMNYLGQVHGSRPMALCDALGTFYYGEYRQNSERSAVHVWRWRRGDRVWSKAWKFLDVRHVHGVFHDTYTDCIWVTTGDEDAESAIWRTHDEFGSLELVAGGSQQLRSVQLLFSADFVYFGSDAPDEQNFLYRMDRNGKDITRVAAVGSSVFYGCKVGESLFFSTAAEPSVINDARYSEVWRSDNGWDWRKVLSYRKDLWPMKYFQYGQVHFPAGPGDGCNLWVSPVATEGQGRTYKISLYEQDLQLG